MEDDSETSAKRGANYKAHEDTLLCQLWVCISSDPIAGIYQPVDDFYSKIKKEFDAELRLNKRVVAERSTQSLKSRFVTISSAVSKFVACHERVVAVCASGRTPAEQVDDAVRVYQDRFGVFRFRQCWAILKDSANGVRGSNSL